MPAPIFTRPIVGNSVSSEADVAELNRVLQSLYGTANPEDRERAEDAANRADTEADRATGQADIATTQAGEALVSAAQADQFATQAELAALAAGAPIVTVLADPEPADGTVVLLKLDAGLQVHEVVSGAWALRGWLVGPNFDTVALLLASTASTFGPVGQIVEAGEFPFEVADPSTPVVNGYPLTNAGGVKLFYASRGSVPVQAVPSLPIAMSAAADGAAVLLAGTGSESGTFAADEGASVRIEGQAGARLTGANQNMTTLRNGDLTMRGLDLSGFRTAAEWLAGDTARPVTVDVIGNKFRAFGRAAILDEENQLEGSDVERALVAFNEFRDNWEAGGSYDVFTRRQRRWKNSTFLANYFSNGRHFSLHLDPDNYDGDPATGGRGSLVVANHWDKVTHPGSGNADGHFIRQAIPESIIALNYMRDLLPSPGTVPGDLEAMRFRGAHQTAALNHIFNGGAFEGQMVFKNTPFPWVLGNRFVIEDAYRAEIAGVDAPFRNGGIAGVLIRNTSQITDNWFQGFNTSVIDTDGSTENDGHTGVVARNLFVDCDNSVIYSGDSLIRWASSHRGLAIENNRVLATPGSSRVPQRFISLGGEAPSMDELRIVGNDVSLTGFIINVAPSSGWDVGRVLFRGNHWKGHSRLIGSNSSTLSRRTEIIIEDDIYEPGSDYDFSGFFGAATGGWSGIRRIKARFKMITRPDEDSRIMAIPVPLGAVARVSVIHEIADTPQGPVIQERVGSIINETGTPELFGSAWDVERLTKFSTSTATLGSDATTSALYSVGRPRNIGADADRGQTISTYDLDIAFGDLPT